MDMQNVSKLQIPEGEVKTIHDEGGRLLWGAVGYNTTYRGDTYQQTYSGANLYNVNDPAGVSTGASVDEDGWITLTANNTGSSATYINYYGEPMQLAADTEYAIVVELKYIKSNNLSNTNNYLRLTDSNSSQFNGTYALPFTSTNPTQVGTHVGILRTKPDISGASRGLRTFLTVAPGVDQEVTFRISVLADTSVTPQTFVYQPFTGNIPAPSPDYPQDVKVATGVQTITITGGTVSKNFTLDLGNNELCKIGDYRDYIYKSSDEWFVHKETGKKVLNGNESWQYNSTNTVFLISDYFDYRVGGFVPFSNYYVGASITGYAQLLNNQIAFLNSSTNNRFVLKNTSLANVTALTTWLSTHNTAVYYLLATPTNTKITDTALISQLEDIDEWLTRYGYDAMVSGTIPLIIDKVPLS